MEIDKIDKLEIIAIKNILHIFDDESKGIIVNHLIKNIVNCDILKNIKEDAIREEILRQKNINIKNFKSIFNIKLECDAFLYKIDYIEFSSYYVSFVLNKKLKKEICISKMDTGRNIYVSVAIKYIYGGFSEVLFPLKIINSNIEYFCFDYNNHLLKKHTKEYFEDSLRKNNMDCTKNDYHALINLFNVIIPVLKFQDGL